MEDPLGMKGPDMEIASDVPQTDPAADQFGFKIFAERIATSITRTSSPQGLVLAIHGEWGSGKTSFLNFVKHYLANTTEPPEPIVIDFNPWWFTDRSDLAHHFLLHLSAALQLKEKALQKAGGLIGDYAGAIGTVASVGTGHPWLASVIGPVMTKFKRPPKSIPKLKCDISEALQEAKQRVVIVVDDIDRLPPEEILSVFRVIKAVADFPNTVYLLACERGVVTDALTAEMKVDGDSYLEKIVQAPFVLPAVSQRKLHKKLFGDLDRLLEGSDMDLFDVTYWGNVFHEGIAPLLTKPRDVLRYINSLGVTYPTVRDEVNVTDFFALELIRLYVPSLYQVIRDYPDRFTGYAAEGIESQQREDDRTFHRKWADQVDESVRAGVQAMMARIFPKLDNYGRGLGFLREWRRLRRVAHPDIFPTYFGFSVGMDQLSRRAMMEFIDELSDSEATERTLLEAVRTKRSDRSSMAKEYLEHLVDYDKEIDPERATNLLNVLGRIGDDLIVRADETGGLFSLPPVLRLNWAMTHALERLPEEYRDPRLIASFEDGLSITYLCHAILTIEDAREKGIAHGSAAALADVDADTVATLKDIALRRIQRLASDGRLLDVPELLCVLIRWREWGGEAAVREWAQGISADPMNLLKFMGAFLSQSKSHRVGDVVGSIRHTVQLKWMAEFIELQKAAEQIDKLEQGKGIDPEFTLVVETFRRQYEVFRQGMDPDGLLSES